MKKITAFFMAFLPFLVVIILFATGLIVKDSKYVFVKSIECIDDSLSIQQTTDVGEELDFSKNVNIIPSIASNPALFYTSDDTDVVKVDYTTGKATTTGFGTTNINIKSQENPSITAKCKVTVWDDKVHKIIIDNKAQTSFVPCNTSIGFETTTIPNVVGQKLNYEVQQGSEKYVDVDTDGKISTKSESGIAYINISSQDRSTTINHKIYVGNIVESIYFQHPSTSIVSDVTYNLASDIHTAPFDIANEGLAASEYLTFTSSDPSIATVDKNGLVTFKKASKDIATLPTFTVRLNGTSITTSKSIASTMDYFLDVSFNRYNYTTTYSSENANKPINADELNWSVYPASSKTHPVVLDSTNKNVVDIENDEFKIKGPGQTVLSVTIETSEGNFKTDKCLVTLLDKDVKIFKDEAKTVEISNSYYCTLGQYVNGQYKNQNIKWSIPEEYSEIAKIDQHGIVNFAQTGKITVQAQFGENEPEEISVTCKCDSTEPRDIKVTASTTYNSKVGEKIRFLDENDEPFDPAFDDEQSNKLTKVDDGIYIVNAGSESVWEVSISGTLLSDTFNFIIEEPAIGVSPIQPELWPYYTTNATIVDVASLVMAYPSTATNDKGEKITPEYKITLEEGSRSVVKDTTITFVKPEMVNVEAKLNDVEYDYGIKSQFGLYGKFTLKDGDKEIQSGESYSLTAGQTKTFKVDDFLLNDVAQSPTKEEMEERFRITSLNSKSTLKDLTTNYDEDKKELTFSFTANQLGSDVVTISNDTFTFIINVEVKQDITGFNLYNSDGTPLSNTSSTASTIKSYSKDLNLFISTDPLAATKKEIKATWNGEDISITNSMIDLDGKEWSSDNVLEVMTKDEKVKSTYHLEYISNVDTFSIEQAVEEGGKNFIYVPSATTTANMTIKISNGLASPSFYNQYFKYSVDGIEKKADSNQINITLPEATDANPGCEKEITITCMAGSIKTIKYNISRDVVSKIVLPNHNNDEESDKKGMQKVHVFGNKSYYTAAEKEIDGYRLPIDIYDYKGVLVENSYKKEELYKTLRVSMKNHGGTALAGSSVAYEDGHLRVKFDNNSLYTNQEIYQNKFASGEKDQTINIATPWGTYNANKSRGKLTNVKYSFVVVDGINTYTQECMIEHCDWQSNIVLQTNFGLEGVTKDNQPFDRAAEWTLCNAIFGNGYAINYDAKTELTGDHQFQIFYVLNLRMIGCNDEKLKMLTYKTCYYQNPGDGKDSYIAYSTFQNFYQPIALGQNSGEKTYIKNCVFYNNRSDCISINHQELFIENCGFFKCSNIGLTLAEKSSIYIKGGLQLYNFVNDELLKDIGGHDFSFMWPLVEPLLRRENMLQLGPDGREYVNSYSLVLLENYFYFYKGVDEEGKDIYEQDEKGNPLAANHLAKGVNFTVPFVGSITAWTTRNPQTEPGAPSYYDEYDTQGNLRTEKLQELIMKLSREYELIQLK